MKINYARFVGVASFLIIAAFFVIPQTRWSLQITYAETIIFFTSKYMDSHPYSRVALSLAIHAGKVRNDAHADKMNWQKEKIDFESSPGFGEPGRGRPWTDAEFSALMDEQNNRTIE